MSGHACSEHADTGNMAHAWRMSPIRPGTDCDKLSMHLRLPKHENGRCSCSCSAKPAHGAAILQQRFQRDRRIDWKCEYHRRRTDLQVFQDQLKV